MESGHSLGTRSPFFDVYYYPLFSRFVRSCETTIHNAVVYPREKKFGFSLSIGKIFSFRIESPFHGFDVLRIKIRINTKMR